MRPDQTNSSTSTTRPTQVHQLPDQLKYNNYKTNLKQLITNNRRARGSDSKEDYTKCMQQKDPDYHNQRAKVYNETKESINIKMQTAMYMQPNSVTQY